MTATADRHRSDDKNSHDLDAISQRLVTARSNAAALQEFPGELPLTLSDAYAVQTASIARWSDTIAGWKVGMVPEELRSELLAERLAGPIFESSIFPIETGSRSKMPIFSGGFAAVEAEFVLRLAKTIEPVRREYSDDDLVELVSGVHVGAEIASSPMAFINELGPRCVVSDFGNNAGLLVGPSIPNWSDLTPDAMTAEVAVDGVVVGSASAAAIEGGLLQALRFLIKLCAERQLVLAAGTYVSSGAVTGIHDVTLDSKAKVDFGSVGAFDVEFEPMQPRN